MSSLPESSRPATAKSVTEPTSISEGWRSRLLKSGDGERERPIAILANAIIALSYCPAWSDVLAFDICSHRPTFRRTPPWPDLRPLPILYTDTDDIRIADWLQRQGIMVGREIAKQAVQMIAPSFPFNPIADHIDSLVWDEDDLRLPVFAARYLGCQQTPYIEAITSRWLISLVARGRNPGCKVDTVLILEGDQGTDKSSALRILGGRWFTDDIGRFDSPHVPLQLMGKWLVELPEIDKLKSTRIDLAKEFLPRQADNYTPKWVGHSSDFPRSCVFAGTVNPSGNGYLKDETGNRRYWPFPIGNINLKALERDREQLIAEAAWMHAHDNPWWVPRTDRVLTRMIEMEQRARFMHHPWEEDIEKFCENRLTVSIAEIMGPQCLDIPKRGKNDGDRTQIGKCLESLGWRIFRPKGEEGEGRPRLYKRK